ncbi:hypothetical protein SLA2020_010510 [Shorea laevis]
MERRRQGKWNDTRTALINFAVKAVDSLRKASAVKTVDLLREASAPVNFRRLNDSERQTKDNNNVKASPQIARKHVLSGYLHLQD